MCRSSVALRRNFVYKPSVNNRADRLQESEEALLLAHLFDLEPERYLRRIPGRLTFLARMAAIEGGARIVVKRFESRAGREGWRERILGQRVRSAGRREFEILAELRTVGVSVPRAIRSVEDRDASSLLPISPGARGRSAVLMECVEHFEDAKTALATRKPRERSLLCREILAQVRKLHERGWIHRDLYLQHFLLPCDVERQPVLIDVARARWSKSPGRRWLVKDLAALLLSTPPNVTRTERLRFLRGWLAGQGLREEQAWKRWAKSVIHKAQRLGAHKPRFEDLEQVIGVEPERDVPRSESINSHATSLAGEHE